MNAYALLGVLESDGDETIKAAYLKAIHRYPPEKKPRVFEALREAYEHIATNRKRLAYSLLEASPLQTEDVLCAVLQNRKVCLQISEDNFSVVLSAGIKQVIQNIAKLGKL